MNKCDGHNWYAVYTKPKCEKSVSRDISKYCETYLPLQTVRKKWSDRYKTLELPLIPLYVFVKLNDQNRSQIYQHPNVLKILTFNGRPASISEKEIQVVKRIEASKIPFMFSHQKCSFSLGDRVIFNSGPLIGEEGYVQKFLNNSRIYIYLPSLSGAFSAEVNDISPLYLNLPMELTTK